MTDAMFLRSEAGGDEPTVHRRVVVAIDYRPESLAALGGAAQLALLLHATLVGVYVSEIHSSRLAEHPAVREVLLGSGAARRPTRLDVDRELKTQSTRARRATATAAGEAGLAWAFELSEGFVAHELMNVASTSYLVTVSRSRGPFDRGYRIGAIARNVLERSRRPILIVSPGKPWRGPVAVLFDGSAGAIAAVDLALELLPAEKRALVLLVPRCGSAEEDEALQDATLRFARRLGVPVQIRPIPGCQQAVIWDALQRSRAGALVLHTAIQFAEPGAFERLIADLDIPVAVVPVESP